MAGGECKRDFESDGREESVMVGEKQCLIYIQRKVAVRSCRHAQFMLKGSIRLFSAIFYM